MSDIKIIHMNKKYLVAIKKPGMLAEESGDALSLPLLVKKELLERGDKDSIYTVHRLDRQVGGLTLLARSPDSASYFTDLIAKREIVKRYLAVIKGVPEATEGFYEDLLFRDSQKNKTYVVDRERKGVRDAKLSYRLIESKETESGVLSLVEIRLYTGRTHQIRVQFASRKTPLYGDSRYGSGDKKDMPALFAYSLSFAEKSGKEVSFSASPEKIFPWTLFDFNAAALSEKYKDSP